MSTLTSADLHVKRSSTRVYAPPGGSSSICFGSGGLGSANAAPPTAMSSSSYSKELHLSKEDRPESVSTNGEYLRIPNNSGYDTKSYQNSSNAILSNPTYQVPPSSHGSQVPSSSHGFQGMPPSSHGYQTTPPSSHGYQIPPSSRGYQQPPPSSHSYQQSIPSSFQISPPHSQTNMSYAGNSYGPPPPSTSSSQYQQPLSSHGYTRDSNASVKQQQQTQLHMQQPNVPKRKVKNCKPPLTSSKRDQIWEKKRRAWLDRKRTSTRGSNRSDFSLPITPASNQCNQIFGGPTSPLSQLVSNVENQMTFSNPSSMLQAPPSTASTIPPPSRCYQGAGYGGVSTPSNNGYGASAVPPPTSRSVFAQSAANQWSGSYPTAQSQISYQGYQTPSQGYQAPSQGYRTPSQGYQIPSQGSYAPPSTGSSVRSKIPPGGQSQWSIGGF